MNEKLIEKKLREEIKKRGGIAYKFVSPNHRGVPDRLLLLPNGKTFFAEIKTTGKRPTQLQELELRRINALGFPTYVVDDMKSLQQLLNDIDTTKQ